jgi:hypothetical protein
MFEAERNPEWKLEWNDKYHRCLCCGKEQEDIGGYEGTYWKTLLEGRLVLGKND